MREAFYFVSFSGKKLFDSMVGKEKKRVCDEIHSESNIGSYVSLLSGAISINNFTPTHAFHEYLRVNLPL